MLERQDERERDREREGERENERNYQNIPRGGKIETCRVKC